MLSSDLENWGQMCMVAARKGDLDQLQEFSRRIGSMLLEAAARAQGMEATAAIRAVPSDPVVIDLSDDTVIPFPKANLRPVPSPEGGAA